MSKSPHPCTLPSFRRKAAAEHMLRRERGRSVLVLKRNFQIHIIGRFWTRWMVTLYFIQQEHFGDCGGHEGRGSQHALRSDLPKYHEAILLTPRINWPRLPLWLRESVCLSVLYRVTHQVVVLNLLLTSKQKLGFSIRSIYWNTTFVLVSTGGWELPDV